MATLHDVPDEIWESVPLHERDVGFYFSLLPYTRLWYAAGMTAKVTGVLLALLAAFDILTA